ncbi:MAG: tetratricopeptide repeat protein [Candidatus Omnitrophota bacterium]
MKLKILKTFIILIPFILAAYQGLAEEEDLLGAQMYNELGVQALQDGAIDSAISYLEQARKLAPKQETIKKNLSIAYYKKGEAEYEFRHLSSAEKYLAASLENDPNNINALVLMGELKYLSQKLDEAKKLWEKVLALRPDYPYADTLKEKLKKLDKEAKVEKEYRSTGMDQFNIKYSKEGTRLSYNVRYYLQEAHRLIGQDFNYQPKRKITVLIYETGDFESISDWQKGVVGVYDGKIRLPLIGANLTSNEIRGIIWHEYTHAIIHDITKGNCPIWLNEGLAKVEEFKYIKKDLSTLESAVKNDQLISFVDLDATFFNPADKIKFELAYEESYTLANYLKKRYSRYKVKRILERLGNNETIESAFKNELNIKMSEFEKRWLNELRAGKLY